MNGFCAFCAFVWLGRLSSPTPPPNQKVGGVWAQGGVAVAVLGVTATMK